MPARVGDHTFGLLDHDAAVQREVELLVEDVGVPDGGPMLQDGDGGHVGERLAGEHVDRVHRSLVGPEQVDGADDLAAQAEREGVHRAESGLEGDGAKLGQRPLTTARSWLTTGSPAW